MEANTAYTHKKLEELNRSLVKLYSQSAGAPDEDAKKWALETLENAREFKKEMETLDESRKKYNEGLSKDILDKAYRLFQFIVETVDSRIMALQELNPSVKYEKSDKLILFNDEMTKAGQYTLVTVVLPKGNRIFINCVPGELKQGLVSKCPSLEFVEHVEGKRMQSFGITPHYGLLSIGITEGKVKLKEGRALRGLTYSTTGEEMLTEQFKSQFNGTFKEFFNIAYGR
jgi:hypothetical protein